MKKFGIAVLLILTIAIGGLFLFGPTLTDRALNAVLDHDPYQVSERAQALHDSLIIGDWHADTLMWNRDIGDEHDYGHIDLARLQRGNVSLQMFTTVTKSPSNLNYSNNSASAPDDITRLVVVQRWPVATWQSLAQRALYQAQKLRGFERENAEDMMVITSRSELATFLERKQQNGDLVGALLGTEGSHALDGDLANVSVLFDAGFRMMSLQHFFDNKLGGSLHGVSKGGLTDFGRKVIDKMTQLGIMLDVSHSSEKTVSDVLDYAQQPLLVSHTGFRGHCDTQRNISDALMQKIAAGGGLIAVGYWAGAVCGTDPRDVVAAMQYGLELVGEDHLSLGSDFDGSVTTALDTSELAALTHHMLVSGFTEIQIRKIMGGNMLKFLQTNLPG